MKPEVLAQFVLCDNIHTMIPVLIFQFIRLRELTRRTGTLLRSIDIAFGGSISLLHTARGYRQGPTIWYLFDTSPSHLSQFVGTLNQLDRIKLTPMITSRIDMPMVGISFVATMKGWMVHPAFSSPYDDCSILEANLPTILDGIHLTRGLRLGLSKQIPLQLFALSLTEMGHGQSRTLSDKSNIFFHLIKTRFSTYFEKKIWQLTHLLMQIESNNTTRSMDLRPYSMITRFDSDRQTWYL